MLGEARRGAPHRHVPALDGLRGVAVAAVLCFHGELAFAGGGFLGVSTFFTLSGFLITTLLLREWDRTGRIDIVGFWLRRVRRLLPAALIALLGIALYAAAISTRNDAHRIGTDGLSALAYVANWRFVFAHQSYASLFAAPSPVQHFWSLAIEEQFYLLYPIVAFGALAVLRSVRRLRYFLMLLTAGSIGLTFLLWSPGTDPSRVYYGTDTRAAELLVGALLATGIALRPRLRSKGRRTARAWIGTASALGLVGLWATTTQADGWLYRGGLVLNAVLTARVIAATLLPGPTTVALSWSPLRALGRISYGVYLYHWPIFLWLSPARTGLAVGPLFAVRVGVTLAVAVASYHLVECPIRYGTPIGWKPRRRRTRRILAPITAAMVAGALLSVGTTASGETRIVFAAVGPSRTTPLQARYEPVAAHAASIGAVDAPPAHRLMIVGDSVAQTLGRGLERWGPSHDVSVLNAARFYCGLARGGRLAMALGHTADQCTDWPRRWADAAARFRPDVVVILTTVWDITPRQRDEWGSDFLRVGDPRFDAFVGDEWAAAVRVARATGARVVWLPAPCAADRTVSTDLGYGTAHLARSAVHAGATVLDWTEPICPAGEFTDRLGAVTDARPDGLHFSDDGADWVANWLGPAIVAPGPGIDAPR